MSDDVAVAGPTSIPLDDARDASEQVAAEAGPRGSTLTRERFVSAAVFAGWVASYTLAFGICALLVFGYLLLEGKSVVWSIDGVTQHFPAFYYVVSQLKQFVAHPSAGIPLWSWQLGLGGDALGTLAYYGVGDPFTLVGLAFPLAAVETAFTIAFFARLYAAGLASLLYFRTMGTSRFGALVGALVYGFTMFTLFATLRHPFFANALVFLPLVLVGIEHVLRSRRWVLLTVAVFLAALGNFYFFYMITLIAVLYAFLRHLDAAEKADRWRSLPRSIAAVGGPYLVGVTMSAVALVPVLVAFFGSSRAPVAPRIPLFYRVADYGAFLADLSTAFRPARSSYTGFVALGVVAALIYFLRRDSTPGVRRMLLAFGVFGALPVFGSLFNGLSFPSNRFLFGWGLFVGLAVADLLTPGRLPCARDVMRASVLYFALSVATAVVEVSPKTLVALGIGAGSLLVIAVAVRLQHHVWVRRAMGPVLLAAVVANLAVNAYVLYSPRQDDYLRDWKDAGVLAEFARDPGSLAATLEPDQFARIEKQRHVYKEYDVSVSSNDPLVQGYRGTAIYFSLVDGDISAFMHALENRSVKYMVGYNGFDDRAALAALSGTAFYLSDPAFERYVPYGFERVGHRGTTGVYHNPNVLPLGFVYEHVVRASTFERLDPLERQQALLVGAVVDDASDAASLPKATLPPAPLDVPWTAQTFGGSRLTSEALTVPRDGAGMQLDVATPPGSEVYVQLDGLGFADPGPRTIRSRSTQSVYLWYSAGGRSKGERFETPANQYYWANTTQLVNLGYRDRPIDKITISASDKGTYAYDTIRVRAVPMAGFERRIDALRANGLRNVSIGKDRLSGDFTSARGGVLFLSVPYTRGWSAMIDGEPAHVERVSVGFSGILVPPGRHRLAMRYRTPGLAAGAALSMLGFVAFGSMFAAGVLRRRRERA